MTWKDALSEQNLFRQSNFTNRSQMWTVKTRTVLHGWNDRLLEMILLRTVLLVFSLCTNHKYRIIKVVRWNRKTFLFSFCFLFFLLLFSFLYRFDWFRDISFVFQPISFKLGRLIDDKRRCCILFHDQRSTVKVTRSKKVFDCNDSIYGQRKITLSWASNVFYLCMQNSSLIHSNSQNNFNYNPIHPT